jgi:hypothetical protein
MPTLSRLKQFVAVAAAALSFITATQATTSVFVDFSRPTGVSVPTNAFGVNSYQGFSETLPNRSAYNAHVSAMLGATSSPPSSPVVPSRGFVRLHREDMMMNDASKDGSSWLSNTTSQTPFWNTTRVDLAVLNSFWIGMGPSAPVLLCFSGFPSSWANTSATKTMSTHYADAWGDLVADLVTHLRTVLPSDTALYVELTNEWDSWTGGGFDASTLGSLVVSSAAKVRAAWPGIKVGGPAWARPDITDHVAAFLAVAGASVDFLSYHAYCTGSMGTANTTVWGCAGDPFVTRWMVANVPSLLPPGTTTVPLLFHDEMNISWDPPDSRMTNGVGAVFDAIFATASVAAGASGVARWNEADGWYGALNNDPAWTPRPPSFVWQLLNTLVPSGADVATSASSLPANVYVFAAATMNSSSQQQAQYSLVISNAAGSAMNVSVEVTGWPNGSGGAPAPSTPVHMWAVSDAGMSQEMTLTLAELISAQGIPMDADSVGFFTW